MIFEKLVGLIAEQFNVEADSITMETAFQDDLNADSVDIVDLSMALEEEFGVSAAAMAAPGKKSLALKSWPKRKSQPL